MPMSELGQPSPMQSQMRLAMGTFATVETDLRAERGARAAIDAAFAVIESIEHLMHPTRAGSDIARINSSVDPDGLEISGSTYEVLALAQRLAVASGGLFDPCPPAGAGGIADVELGPGGHVCCRQPVQLDLGGIAKGYAVDQALRCLRAHGAENALVNIGGDMAAIGSAGFVVGVRVGEQVIRHQLRDRALAVTDTHAEQGPPEHRGYYSRVGQRQLRRTFAAVTAPSAAVADALTKCALYCDDAEWSALARLFDATLIT
jgi:thiamine biosynthesis lipoprotein